MVGRYVKQNSKRAAFWLEKAVKLGEVEASIFLGLFYYKGIGVKKNLDEAFRLFRLASSHDHPSGQFLSGICYANGEGTNTDEIMAEELFAKAFATLNSQTNWDPITNYYLSLCYESGCGTSINIPKAMELLQAEGMDKYIPAQCHLALCLLKGQNITQNIPLGLEKLTYAAENGDVEAAYNLAKCKQKGLYMPINSKEAANLYKFCAKQCFAPAQYELAMCFKNGIGLQKDINKANAWFKKAAKNGEVKSIGLVY